MPKISEGRGIVCFVSLRTKSRSSNITFISMIQSREQLFDGKIVRQRIDYWMNLFFKFDKGKYATRSKHLNHDWYLAQVEVCSNIIFKSARFCTSLFERLLDKFSRVGLTPLLKYSACGLPVHIPNLSGDCMITTPASSTGSGEMPSSSTIKRVI